MVVDDGMFHLLSQVCMLCRRPIDRTAPSIIQTVKNSVQLYIVNVDLKLLYLRYILDKGHSYPYQWTCSNQSTQWHSTSFRWDYYKSIHRSNQFGENQHSITCIVWHGEKCCTLMKCFNCSSYTMAWMDKAWIVTITHTSVVSQHTIAHHQSWNWPSWALEGVEWGQHDVVWHCEKCCTLMKCFNGSSYTMAWMDKPWNVTITVTRGYFTTQLHIIRAEISHLGSF